MIGAVLFQNVSKLNWYIYKDAVPAFCALFYITMTDSILVGASIGYIAYILIHIFTGDMEKNMKKTWNSFTNPDTSNTKRSRARKKKMGLDDDITISVDTEGGTTATYGGRGSVIYSCIESSIERFLAMMDEVDERENLNMGVTGVDNNDLDVAASNYEERKSLIEKVNRDTIGYRARKSAVHFARMSETVTNAKGTDTVTGSVMTDNPPV